MDIKTQQKMLNESVVSAGMRLENVQKYIDAMKKANKPSEKKLAGEYLQTNFKFDTGILQIVKNRLNSVDLPKVEVSDDGFEELLNFIYSDGWDSLKILFNYMVRAPYSSLFDFKQTSEAGYSCAVPLIMDAYKKQHGTKYQEWNKALTKDKFRRVALGNKALAETILDRAIPNSNLYDDVIEENVKKIAKESLLKTADGKIKKHIVSAPMFRRIAQPVTLLDKYYNMQNYHGRAMLLQVNLWNKRFRLPGEMILDPFNWDRIPEPWDFIEELEKKSKKEHNDTNIIQPSINTNWDEELV